MKHFTFTLIGCLAFCLAASTALAGESAAPAKPPVVAPLPVPDATLPLQFDLFVGPLSKEDMAKHKALLEKNLLIGRGHLPGQPFMFGFTLVNGRPIKPLSRRHGHHRARGFSIEETPDIGHCSYGTWDKAMNHRDEFHAFTVERQDDTLRGACDFTATVTDQAKVELKITWTAKIIGGTQVEGQAEVRWGDMVVTRPLLGIVRQGLNDLVNPLNCIYQFTDGMENAWAVVEVKEGKPVRSLGHVRGQSEIRLRQVNADSLRITRHDHGVNGWKADLEGSIGIEGGPTFALGGLKIGVNGIGWGVQGVAVRAYHPQHPVARDWEGLAKALFAQIPVPAEAAERAKRQAAQQPAMPPPSAAAKYHFKHRPYQFTYAPWLDFEAVPGAVEYRIGLFVGRNGQDLKKDFTTTNPRASLAPLWLEIPSGEGAVVRCTALDAAGKPLGEPQSRSVTRKPSFGERGAMGAVLAPDQAEQAALRCARVRSQRDLGLMPLWEHLVSKGYPSVARGVGQMLSPIWLPVAIAGNPGYERDLARAVMSHYGRWLDTQAYANDSGVWLGPKTFPMGIPYSYGSRYYYAPQLYMPRRLDQYEFSRDPRTGEPALYEASLPEPAPQAMQAVLQRLTKLQQPSGGWSAADVKVLYAPLFYSGASFFGIPWLDFNAGSFANIAGRLRTSYGCTGEALAMELKSQHWLDGNALRTGWWEVQIQQGYPGERCNTSMIHLMPYLDYLLEYAPPQIADLDQAETLARFIEDCFITWENDPRFNANDLIPICSMAYPLPAARAFLRLHQRTGDPLWLAKADALFALRLRREDPVWGRVSLIAFDHAESSEHPLDALRYLALRREIAAKPPAPADDPTQGHLVLTLDRLFDRAERAVVHLAVNGGSVQHAFATTPTRRPVDIDFTQPGRLHVYDSTILHHAVDASGLKIGKDAIGGTLTVQIAGEKEPLKITVSLKPDHRLWRGAWTWGDQTGRAAVEVRPAALAKPKRAHVELCNAVTGGEAWQNWAMAMWDLKPDGAVSGSWLGNNNAGWTAAVQESSLKVTGTQIEGVLKVAATWEGVADTVIGRVNENGHRQIPNTKDGPTNPEGSQAKEWHTGKKAWLANWIIGPQGRNNFYYGGFQPLPPYVADNGNVLRYQTTFKPVTAGTYTYRFTGHRLGDVLAGTVTVKGPDGKERQTQFLGGVE